MSHLWGQRASQGDKVMFILKNEALNILVLKGNYWTLEHIPMTVGFLPPNALIKVMSQFSLIAILASNSLNFYSKPFKCLAGYLEIKKRITLYIARKSSWTLTGGNMTPTAHDPTLTLTTLLFYKTLLFYSGASTMPL